MGTLEWLPKFTAGLVRNEGRDFGAITGHFARPQAANLNLRGSGVVMS